jgi:hypothetical protein
MVSERRPAPSIPESEVSTSGGIFLLSFTYWSNCARSVRRIASISVESGSSETMSSISAFEVRLVREHALDARALHALDRGTFTVPSGSFSICRMVETVPTS